MPGHLDTWTPILTPSTTHPFGGVSAQIPLGTLPAERVDNVAQDPGGNNMGIGVSVFLLAVGAILAFAVNVEASGFSISTVGIILMVAGALGLLMTTLVLGRRDRGTTVVGEERVVTRERDVY